MKQLYIRAGNYSDSIYLSAENKPCAEWTRIEYYAVASDVGVSNGAFYMRYTTPGGIITPYNKSSIRTYGNSNRWRYLHFGHYWGNGFSAAGAYFDDVFVQYGTQARVEIGDKSTWVACTYREIQIPTAWSDGSVTVTVNKGSFGNCETAYLYVIDENGNVNANGIPVKIVTGAGEPPCPPSGLKIVP